MDEKFDANQTFAELLETLNMNNEIEEEVAPVVEETIAEAESSSPVIQVLNLSVSEELKEKVETELNIASLDEPIEEALEESVEIIEEPKEEALEIKSEETFEEILETKPFEDEKIDIDAIFEKAEKEQEEKKTQKDETSEGINEDAIVEYYSIVETTGLIFGNFFIKLWLVISTVCIDIFNLIKSFIKMIIEKLYVNVILAIKNFKSEWVVYKNEQNATSGQIKDDIKKSPLQFFKIIRYYRKAFYGRHPMMFANFINTVLPIVGFAILLSTILGIKTTTYALEVNANGADLGYVENENVYLTAQSLVKERFNTTIADETNNADVGAIYKIVEVKANELLDSSTVSDNIIENADTTATYACGVYIDGELLCAVQSETDAMQVFNNIIDSYPKDSANDTVGFVEEVQYVQGLYEDNDEVIWTADKLQGVLTGEQKNTKTYTVAAGDNLESIASANGMTVDELKAANPNVGDELKEGQLLKVTYEKNYLNVKVVKTVVQRQTIAYKTIKTNNSKLYKGTTKTKQKGQNGIDSVTYLVTYINGVKQSSKEINRVTIKSPVDEKIDVGTKVVSGGYTSSTYRKGYGKLIWPAVGVHQVSSRYGYRTMSGRTKFHKGIDLTCGGASGHTVVAAASGTVTYAGYDSSYGYYVMINHGNGMTTLYAHMLSGSIRVKTGQSISGGTAIGKVGSTGHSTGPHLHFEVRINGSNVNPAPYIGA